MREEERQDKLQRFLETKKGMYIDNVVSLAVYVLVGFGIFTLFIASTLVTSYDWGGPVWNPAGYGARIYPGFYEVRNISISLLLIASILYPIRLWFDDIVTLESSVKLQDYNIYVGLLLPTIFTFGQPFGSFNGGDPGFSLTGIITPIYNFTFSGFYEVNGTLTFSGFPSPLLVLGLISFILGIAQIAALKKFEKGLINLKLFLLPIVVYLVFSFFVFGNGFPSGYFTFWPLGDFHWFTLPHFTEVCHILPMFTIGVLVKAFGIKKRDS